MFYFESRKVSYIGERKLVLKVKGPSPMCITFVINCDEFRAGCNNNVESLFSEQIVIIIFADGLSVTSLQCLGMKRIAVNNNIKSYEI